MKYSPTPPTARVIAVATDVVCVTNRLATLSASPLWNVPVMPVNTSVPTGATVHVPVLSNAAATTPVAPDVLPATVDPAAIVLPMATRVWVPEPALVVAMDAPPTVAASS